MYLCETDYFIAPASSGNNHGGKSGGLFEHSLMMYESLKKLNELVDNRYSDETLLVIAFCHDICKVNTYVPKEKWFKNNKGDWESYLGYEIVDKFPIGHGEKSLYITSKYLDLTDDEAMAIRWHMGSFEVGTILNSNTKYSFQQAQDLSPIVRMTHCADLMSISMSQHRSEQEKN